MDRAPKRPRERVPRRFLLAGAVAVLALGACASTPTQFASTWTDHSYSGPPLRTVAVLALMDSESDSRIFETEATQMLKDKGVNAVAGHAILEPGQQYSEKEMEQHLRKAEVDGVLIFRLIGENKRHEYINPTPYIGPVPPGMIWGDPFYWYYYPNWNYYWYWRSSRAVTAAPGYWAASTYYVIESSLYANKPNRLVWTAKSETLDGVRVENIAQSVTKQVARRLDKLGLVAANGNAPGVAANERRPRAGERGAG